jgi:ABC-2 type transport system ATP-binding protein
MIEVAALSKRYGDTVAVSDLSFRVLPGFVTGFLGPNGAGKSTTMRLILGLDTPTTGTVTVNGRPYNGYRRPLLQVGALLEAQALHGGRSAQNHLLSLALSNGIGRSRVQQVLQQVGLSNVARRRAGGFSLGMAQRLGIAAALLGDPPVLLLDEPVNGLDPDGVIWIRSLLKSLAGEGRTVFLSSHLMSEMAMTAQRLIIIGRGELIADTTVQQILDEGPGSYVLVRSPDSQTLATLLTDRGATVTLGGDGSLQVTGTSIEMVGEIARGNSITLAELSTHHATLEQRYMELTKGNIEHQASDAGEFADAAA